MKYLIYVGISLITILSNSSFAMTEKELQDKFDFVKLTAICSEYNHYANDLKESKRLRDLSILTYLDIASEVNSKFKLSSDFEELPPEVSNRFNDDFHTGYMLAYIEAVKSEEASFDIFGVSYGLSKREFPTEERKKGEIIAKELIAKYNCKFIR